ncbi:galactose-1-phosphate uridylyltransferase [Apiospora rasikravindrae]|uniref:Galactose-1-phosphate uridylyltransferase n=1 Tax=Apiospora rasikravindrae TaxID=990691 RepID=A0ABR1TYI2_9PEZI
MPEKILDDISHRRYNPLKGSWLLVSPHRTKRPWQGQQEGPSTIDLPEYDPKASTINMQLEVASADQPSVVLLMPSQLASVRRQQPRLQQHFCLRQRLQRRERATGRLRCRVLQGCLTIPDLSSLLLRAEGVKGRCYVLTFSPKHNVTLPDMSAAEILPIIETWTRIYASHLAPTNPLTEVAAKSDLGEAPAETKVVPPKDQLRYMQIFENKGAAMGCSNPHPHCQIWTTSTLPEEPAAETVQMAKYRAEHGGRHLLADYVKLEMDKQERVVWQNDAFLVVCPWWAVWPFEVMILAKRHVRALVDLTAAERLQLAEAVQEVTRRYDNLFETSFPYSSGIHQAPLEGSAEEVENSYFHMHFYPPLLRSATVRKFLVGYELMAEPQRDITPEQAAARLRDDCGGELYRKKM